MSRRQDNLESGDKDHERRVLPDHVRFFGETIAGVAATSRRIAEQVVQAIEVEYEEIPAVFSSMRREKKVHPRFGRKEMSRHQ